MIATLPEAPLGPSHIHRLKAMRPYFADIEGINRRTSAPRPSCRPRTLSPASSMDEMEAAAALISMPSYSPNAPQRSPGKPFPLHTFSFPVGLPMCQPASPVAISASDVFLRHAHRHINSVSSVGSLSDASEESGYFGNETSPGVFFTGSVSLALSEDDDVLSPLHCFMRKFCVEAFSADQDDVATPRYGKSHGGKIVVGQVGIRCIHCKHLSIQRRPERAACFPSSLRNIYHSIETWQRRHSAVCTELPRWIRKTMIDLMQSSKTSAGGRRHYWEDSAEKVGLVDTSHGVRFGRSPGLKIYSPSLPVAQPSSSTFPSTSIPLVSPGDKQLVSDYLFLLMDQMQLCKFTEEDREGGRSKVKDCEVGFHGMECKHCNGKAGFGRYFPSSSNALALANSDRNIYNHLRKCRRCPKSIQDKLKELRPESSKNKRGSRKHFFSNIWERMHGPN
jgi:hypothetical protein